MDGPSTDTSVTPKRLVRRTDDKMVAGVCSGIADYFGIDPLLVRIGAVALLFAGGSGVLAYLIAWVVLPADDGTPPLLNTHPHPSWTVIVGGILVLIGVWALLDNVFDWDDHILGPVLLLGLGGWLLAGRPKLGGSDETVPPPPGPPGGGGGSPGDPVAQSPTAVLEVTAPTSVLDPARGDLPPSPPAPPTPSDPPRHRRGGLGAFTMGLLFFGAGTVGLLAAADVDVDPVVFVAVALALVGVSLVVGAWWGGGRGLIVIGLLLLGMLSGMVAIDVPLKGGVGDRTYSPESVRDVRDTYRLAAGSLTVDLRDVDFGAVTRHVEATVGFGELIVIVPDDVAVTVDAHAAAGEMVVLDRDHEGWDLDDEISTRGREGDGRLELDTRVGFGSVEVRRAAA